MLPWIDTHCHLDAPEFAADLTAVVARAQAAGVQQMVLPAVQSDQFAALQALARQGGWAYALGVHPLYVVHEKRQSGETAVASRVAQALVEAQTDPQCVAVGEIGLDGFVAGLDWDLQQAYFLAQLRCARDMGWPVLLHVRRSVDAVLAGLRRIGCHGGIAHAFNGSLQQAHALLDLGFCLGFGGAMTFDRALQIRRLAQALPADALVLETDAPDIPPHWLYRTAAERAQGMSSRNEPAELPRMAQTLAELRGWSAAETAQITAANACRVLPRLAQWQSKVSDER